MKHRFTLFLVLLFSLPALAQRDYRPGFVIDASGDTLRGFINFRESRAQNQRCLFKPAATGTPQEYTPETALGYGFFGDQIYESIQVRLDSVVSARRVFAWVLVRGKADLLEVGSLFYARKGGELFPLTRTMKDVYVGNRWYKAEDRDYERLLTAYIMADCPSIRLSGGGGVRYTADALTNLFEIYNRCTNSAVTLYSTAKPWTKWEWSVYGGANQTVLNLFSVETDTDAQTTTGFTPVFGVQVGFSSPRKSERFSTHLGFVHSSDLYSGSIQVPQGNTMTRSDVFVRIRSLQIPLFIRYGFIKQKLKPFVQMGIAARFNAVGRAWYQSEVEINSVVTTERRDLTVTRTTPLSLLAGAGFHTNLRPHLRLTAELRAERGLGPPFVLGNGFRANKPAAGFSFLVGLGLW